VRSEMKSVDYRPQVAYWAEIREKIGDQVSLIALTEDYGNRLAYWGWQLDDEWPTTGDQNLRELAGKAKTFDEIFNDRSVGKQYFLVTQFKQFDSQPDLKDKLFNTYPILEQTPDYIIFDLQHPLKQP
jgi:hypothetical protein